MEKTATKKITGLLTLLFAFATFCTYAQTNKEEKTKQQKQDEQGAVLKKWFDEGDIIIDAYIEDGKSVQFTNTKGELNDYTCLKVKVTRVLKGKLNVGYVNLKIDFADIAHDEGVVSIDYYQGVGNRIFPNTRYFLKIKKTDVVIEGYTTENKGVYERQSGAKPITPANETELFQQLHDYCGVKVDKSLLEKKSPNNTEQINNALLYQQKVNNYKELHQFAVNQLQKNKANKVSSTNQCSEIFISEYFEGHANANDKSIEIYNPTNAAINLSGYSILIYHGSSHTPTTIALTGTISAYGTHIVSKTNASAAILARTNQTSNNLNFNGDEIIVLNKASIHIDKIGVIGTAIGSGGWTLTPTGSTVNTDLRRIYAIGVGDTNWTNCKAEWSVFPTDSISNLGQHKSHCAVDPDLNVGLANAYSVDSSNGKSYFEFDIVVNSAGTASTYLDYTEIDLTYDTAALGPNVVANNKITLKLGPLFSTTTYTNPQSSLLGGVDTISMIFSSNHSNGTWNRVAITTSTVQLIRVFIEVGNRCNHNANVQFFNTSFTSFFSFFDNGAGDDPNNSANNISYDNVYYTIGNPLNYTKPCAGTPFITSISPDTVIAGAYYIGIVNNESQLTINGGGFGGAAKPTVLMRNAVNNSAPFYIALDASDIQTWSNTQIVLNVPSFLLDSSGNYPGTGLVKVVPAGSTDTAVSSSPVFIPYSLLNIPRSTNKRRVGFAYKFVTDSAGGFNADTAAYVFRFDGSTIGNASATNAFCRPLLKQAIHDWQCGLPIRYRIGKDTTITTTNADGISYITFRPTLSKPTFAAETQVRVLQCTSTITYFANEADISFKINPGFPWQYVSPTLVTTGSPNPSLSSSGPDFFTTALHELGHATLMLHVNQTSDLMYYKIPATGVGPYISVDDSTGGTDNKNWSKTFNFSSCVAMGAITIPASGAAYCVDPTSGIPEIIGNNTIEINAYPNPAGSYLNVTFVKDKESSNTVKLTNLLGQAVFYRNIGKNEGANEVINLVGLAKGIYILIVTDNQNTITKKIIIE